MTFGPGKVTSRLMGSPGESDLDTAAPEECRVFREKPTAGTAL